MDDDHYIPYREIVHQLDIRDGDSVLLTSDILKLAMKARKKEKEFSATAFIDGFSNALGEEGTLLIPAYNYDLENGDVFSVADTRPMTGALALAVMGTREYLRTLHPLHSFFVRGKDAFHLSELKNTSSFGSDSPFAWMLKRNTLMVFAGTTVAEALTFTHFVEETEQVRYRKYKKLMIRYTDAQGNTSPEGFSIFSKKPGWTMQLEKLNELLSGRELKEYRINGIPFSAIRARDAFEVISKDIRENRAASIVTFSLKLYFRDIIKHGLIRFNLFRTTYGKIRSAKRFR